MESVNKKSKGLVVAVVILSLLLVGLLGYVLYDKYFDENEIAKITKKYDESNKQVEELKKQLETKENKTDSNQLHNYISLMSSNGKEYNVYAIGDIGIVFSYQGELYLSDSNMNIFGSIMDTDVKFSNSVAEINPSTDKIGSSASIRKLNVKESDIERVKIYKAVFTKDSTYNVYLIYKDGSVKRIDSQEWGTVTVLTKYKVNDLAEECGSLNEYGNCTKISYKITLQDGTTKEVTE